MASRANGSSSAIRPRERRYLGPGSAQSGAFANTSPLSRREPRSNAASYGPHYRASVAVPVPSVHDIEITLRRGGADAAVSAGNGDLAIARQSAFKPSNGAANESEQSVCFRITLCPMNEGSQCAVMFHLPATLWQLALLLPPLADDELGLGATEGLRERGAQHDLIVRREHASRQFARGHPFLRTAMSYVAERTAFPFGAARAERCDR